MVWPLVCMNSHLKSGDFKNLEFVLCLIILFTLHLRIVQYVPCSVYKKNIKKTGHQRTVPHTESVPFSIFGKYPQFHCQYSSNTLSFILLIWRTPSISLSIFGKYPQFQSPYLAYPQFHSPYSANTLSFNLHIWLIPLV